VPSQTDLDQGGANREWDRSYRGPSVGWIWVPKRNAYPGGPITAAGTYALDPSTNYVEVNCTGLVTFILPSAVDPAVGPQAQPGLFARPPLVIVDVGGHASIANPITIQRNNSAENIMGLASITIVTAYGGYTLSPSSSQKGWTAISP
jgi:hypothetical protein